MAATTSGATNCAPRAALNTEPTAVVRSRVGNSSANMGPKLDHVPVPKPTSPRQRRRGGHPTIPGWPPLLLCLGLVGFGPGTWANFGRSEEHTSELQSHL